MNAKPTILGHRMLHTKRLGLCPKISVTKLRKNEQTFGFAWKIQQALKIEHSIWVAILLCKMLSLKRHNFNFELLNILVRMHYIADICLRCTILKMGLEGEFGLWEKTALLGKQVCCGIQNAIILFPPWCLDDDEQSKSFVQTFQRF